MSESLSASSTSAWQDNILKILAQHAHHQSCITYAALAHQAEIPAPHRIHQLTTFLETLTAQDVSFNRPIRAAIVISKTGTGLPADGFFIQCAELGIFSAENFPSKQHFHHHCLQMLFTPAQNS